MTDFDEQFAKLVDQSKQLLTLVTQHNQHVYAWQDYCHNHTRQYDHHVGTYWLARLDHLVDGVFVRVRRVP